jgi:predicted small lipoprotein YifL
MTRLILAATLLATLAACGKVGAPHPVGPAEDINYPKSYPTH